MQAKIMERVKYLEPLSNTRIALTLEEAVKTRCMLPCNQGDSQFNQMMRENLQMGVDFEVISKDQWCLLVKFFSEQLENENGEEGDVIRPTPLIRSYELLGMGIRTQIEYFFQQVSITEGHLLNNYYKFYYFRETNLTPLFVHMQI